MVCEACKTIPPVVAEGYQQKGEFTELAGLKTYVVGPKDAKVGILDIYDVFGFAPQTIQGADALSHALNAVVVIPDYLKGVYAQGKWFHGGDLTEEENKQKGEFFGYAMNFQAHLKEFLRHTEEVKKQYPSVESWGAVGLCWGGKVAAVASAENTPLKVSGQVHPGALAKEDAEKITIPHIVLASNGEDPAVVKQYEEVFAAGNGKVGEIETYPTMHHGWMGARANLDQEDNLKEYERGYNQIAKFFSKHL